MARRLEVNVREVADAMNPGRDDQCAYFLDLTTGDVVVVFPEGWDVVEDEPDIDADPDRYEKLPRLDARERYDDMAEFVGTVEDRDVADLLSVALQGQGAFRRFRDVVSRDRALEQRWYAFQRASEHAQAMRWLRKLDLEIVDISPPPPAPAPAPAPRARTVGLIDFLLLGAPDGKTEIINGRIRRQLLVRDAGERRRVFRDLARDICLVCDTPWRKRLVEDKTSFDLDRFHLRLLDDRIELAVDTPTELWRRFADG